jgi:hypothetical protein
VHFPVRGVRLKTDDNIAYIAYIMVLISVQAMATRPRATMLHSILITIPSHCLHCLQCKDSVRFVSCKDSVRFILI